MRMHGTDVSRLSPMQERESNLTFFDDIESTQPTIYYLVCQIDHWPSHEEKCSFIAESTDAL